MSQLGTKKFWRAAPGASETQKENQILKNAGYINLQLYSVNYMSKGNFWQTVFGGRDNIALATTLKYQSGVTSIEATTVQDVREVKVNKNYNFGLQQNIAVKIPSTADAISIDVKMTAIKNDALQAKFAMLNKPEYKSGLQLAPVLVGQILTVTSLVKTLFTDSEPAPQLEASYAGIISVDAEDNPVSNGKLTKGLLIMLSTNEGDTFTDTDESKFGLTGDSLYYDNQQIENTYVLFNISYELLKGDDENSNWFKKYNEALNNLDKIRLNPDSTEVSKIYDDSKTLWIQGNALIDADATYINSEKIKIKNAAIKSLNDQYNDLTHPNQRSPLAFSNDILKGLTGSTNFHSFTEALPLTGSFLNENNIIDPNKPLTTDLISKLSIDNDKFLEVLNKDTEKYLNDLKQNNLGFKLGK